jgi:O-antigen ligase
MSTGAARHGIGGAPRAAIPVVAALGLIAAVAVSRSLDATMVLVAVAALAGSILLVLRVEWALPTMAVFSVLRLANAATETHGAPSLFQLLLIVIAFGIAARWLHTRERPTGGGSTAILAGIFVLVAAASLFASSNPSVAAADFESLYKDALLAVLAGMLLRDPADLRRVVWAMVASGAVLATLSTYQFAVGAYDQSFLGFARSSVENIVDATDDVRVSGPIGDPNYYAQLLVMLLPLALDRLWSERRRILRVAAAYAAAVMTATILFTFSRGGAVGLVMVGVLMLVKHPPSKRAVAAVLLVAAASLPFLPDGYVARLTTLGQVGTVEGATDVSIRARTSELAAGVEMFLDHPLTGIGYGTFAHNYLEYARATGIEQVLKGREAHNLYLEVAAETGLPGLIAFGALAAGTFAAILKGRAAFLAAGRHHLANTCYAIGVSLVGYYVTSVFLHMDFARPYWLLTGLALALPGVAATVSRESAVPREAAWR